MHPAGRNLAGESPQLTTATEVKRNCTGRLRVARRVARSCTRAVQDEPPLDEGADRFSAIEQSPPGLGPDARINDPLDSALARG